MKGIDSKMENGFKGIEINQVYDMLKMINKAVLYTTTMIKNAVSHLDENKLIYIEKLKKLQYYIISLSEKIYSITEISFHNLKWCVKEVLSWIK